MNFNKVYQSVVAPAFHLIYQADSDIRSINDLTSKLPGRLCEAKKSALMIAQNDAVKQIANIGLQLFLIFAYSYRYNRFLLRYVSNDTVKKICMQSKPILYKAHNFRRGIGNTKKFYQYKKELSLTKVIKAVGYVAQAALGFLVVMQIFFPISGPIASAIILNYRINYAIYITYEVIPMHYRNLPFYRQKASEFLSNISGYLKTSLKKFK